MAHLTKTPLTGPFAYASTFLLEDHGFKNIESCSHNSIWVGHNIKLNIKPDEIVTDYSNLFKLIYDSGINYGKYIERRLLIDATSEFITNYKKHDDID